MVKCQNCGENYIFERKDNLYTGVLKIYEEIQGTAFNFGKGEVDDNYLFKQDLFFGKNNIGESISVIEMDIRESLRYIGVCILCNNQKKKAFFSLVGIGVLVIGVLICIFLQIKNVLSVNKMLFVLLEKFLNNINFSLINRGFLSQLL